MGGDPLTQGSSLRVKEQLFHWEVEWRVIWQGIIEWEVIPWVLSGQFNSIDPFMQKSSAESMIILDNHLGVKCNLTKYLKENYW